jgi:hypothetical protein
MSDFNVTLALESRFRRLERGVRIEIVKQQL